MDKLKQIKEMAKTSCVWFKDNKCIDYEGNITNDCNLICNYGLIMRKLFDAGYRKIPEGAVVLTEEEYSDMFTFKTIGDGGKSCGFYNILDTVRKIEREKTVKAIIDDSIKKTELVGDCDEVASVTYYTIEDYKIDRIAKQYGREKE